MVAHILEVFYYYVFVTIMTRSTYTSNLNQLAGNLNSWRSCFFIVSSINLFNKYHSVV